MRCSEAVPGAIDRFNKGIETRRPQTDARLVGWEAADALKASLGAGCVCCPRGRRTVRSNVKALIAAGVLALGPCAASAADPITSGESAAARAGYATAVELPCPIADQGSALAQDELGRMYFRQVPRSRRGQDDARSDHRGRADGEGMAFE